METDNLGSLAVTKTNFVPNKPEFLIPFKGWSLLFLTKVLPTASLVL